MNEAARHVFLHGFAQFLSQKALKALLNGIQTNDPKLIQEGITTPPPLMAVLEWPCAGACAIGYAGWKSEDLQTVGEVQSYFANACMSTDNHLDEDAVCRWFLNWFDDTPRPEVLKHLADWIETALENKTDIPPIAKSLPF